MQFSLYEIVIAVFAILNFALGYVVKQPSKVELTKNKERKFGAAEKYLKFKLNYNGKTVWMLATKKDLEAMRERAEKNPEDL
jgi:hypothetical protein